MAPAPATPPKFVPTLTDEVKLPPELVDVVEPPAVEIPGGYELPAGVPEEDAELPEEVTALELPEQEQEQDLVKEPVEELPVLAPLAAAIEPAAVAQDLPVLTQAVPSPLPDGYEEYVVHRVMQRVDVLLEQRLTEAIATVIHEQTRSIVPRLREEVESVVRQSVYEAVADELAASQK